MENDQSASSVSSLALGGAITGIFVLIFSTIYLFFRTTSPGSKTNEIKTEDQIKSKNDRRKTTAKSTTSKPTRHDVKVTAKFVHPWLCASLKAHSSSVTGLDFSHNDKYLASVATGNSISMFSVRKRHISFVY